MKTATLIQTSRGVYEAGLDLVFLGLIECADCGCLGGDEAREEWTLDVGYGPAAIPTHFVFECLPRESFSDEDGDHYCADCREDDAAPTVEELNS